MRKKVDDETVQDCNNQELSHLFEFAVSTLAYVSPIIAMRRLRRNEMRKNWTMRQFQIATIKNFLIHLSLYVSTLA